ncbi:MAG: phage tail protein [Phaeodactylibacter sp.]|nr:phage tail protein [Phaeodactylibacter sp.]
MATYYPPVGFHFRVDFQLPDITAKDIEFQEVSGLNVSVEMESYAEGGENRFVHKLPVRTTYSDLTLKRGLLLESGVTKWVKNAIDKFEFVRANLIVTLLNEKHQPLMVWDISQALPIAWEIDALNAQESKVLVESLKLSYQYFRVKKG